MKREYKRKQCTVAECEWKETRLERHFKDKQYISHMEATQLNRKVEYLEDSSAATAEPTEQLTISSLCEEFILFYQSFSGGHYVPDILPEHLQIKQMTCNKIKALN